MRNIIALSAALLIISSFIPAQKIIENPEKPLSKNAGRVLSLEEEMRIVDTGEGFYFKYPRNLKIAPDESIFMADHEQLLQFSPEGKFIRNFFKKGQGPGEMQSVRNIFFSDDYIIIQSDNPSKILWLSYNGELAKEFRIYEEISFLRLFLYYNDVYYFGSQEFPETQGVPKVVDIQQNIMAFSQDGNEMKKLTSFPMKAFIISRGGTMGGTFLTRFMAVPYQSKYLFISYTPEYLLKMYDVEANQILRTFSRMYNRVKSTPVPKERRGGITIGGKKYSPPSPKYLNDIRNLFAAKELLWVETSTTDEEKGVLIDVFNPEGRYVDNFYLKMNGILMTVHGDSLFVRERDKDENIQIVKYKIVE